MINPVLTIVLCSVILVALIASILIKKWKFFNYWVVALVGAIVLICCQLIPIQELGNQLFSNSSINPLKILVLFFSMTFLSIYLDEVGLFSWLANKAVRRCKGKQIWLFVIIYFLVGILTIFTSNDIVILTFTPFICYFCKRSKINPIPYLVSLFAAANTWSMMLIIGNPTNIYIGTYHSITFINYLKTMWIPTICAGFAEFFILLLVFWKKLKVVMEYQEIEEEKIQNKVDVIVGSIALLSCLVLFIISSYVTGMEMWLISLCTMGVELVYIVITSIIRKHKCNEIVVVGKRLPWSLIPFVLSMFVVVITLNYQGITKNISDFLSGFSVPELSYGISSFISCNLMNNIPMSILFGSFSFNDVNKYNAIYSIIIGSNLGAFLTPIGALAGIMFTGLVKKFEIKYSFIDFIKYGAIVGIPTLFVALGMLIVVL